MSSRWYCSDDRADVYNFISNRANYFLKNTSNECIQNRKIYIDVKAFLKKHINK